jgi:hypothetical protein
MENFKGFSDFKNILGSFFPQKNLLCDPKKNSKILH